MDMKGIVSAQPSTLRSTITMLREITVVVLVIALTMVSINAEIRNSNQIRRKTLSTEDIVSRYKPQIDALQMEADIMLIKNKIPTTYACLGSGTSIIYSLFSGFLAMVINPIFIILPPILSLITGGFIYSGITDNLFEKWLTNDRQKELIRDNKDLKMTVKALRTSMFFSSSAIVYAVELAALMIVFILFIGLCILGGILSDNSIPEDQL